MITKLVIAVERGQCIQDSCGTCYFSIGSDCEVFGEGLEWHPVGGYKRLPQCLAAEHEAMKLERIGDYATTGVCPDAIVSILDEEAP